jgi:LDH2 family malate/lactate/ureidoglycolate dehydrogenase
VIASRIRAGLTAPAADADVAWVAPAAAAVDGRRGLGPVVGLQTIDEAIARAPRHGAVVAAVRNANHLGLLAPYVERCADAGVIGVALTTSEALVHPWGGRLAQIGTNPIAVAVPAQPEPFVFDMATGVVSMGKILDHRNRGAALEPGWAIDRDGRPTLSAAAAADGAIAPFGGAKGYGLGLAFELLVGALTGSALGRTVTGTLDAASVCNKGDLFLCFDPAVFGADDAVERVTSYLRELRETPPQEGFDGVLVPGDRARAVRARRLSEGVAIADPVWQEVQALRVELLRSAVA